MSLDRATAPPPPSASAPSHVPVRHERLDLFAIAVMTLICLLMGVGQVAMKVANAGISPLFQAGLRSLGAAVLIGLWCRWRGIAVFVRDGTLWPLLLASAFFAIEFALLYPGLERTTASRAVIFLYTSPFVVALGAHFLIAGDRLTASKTAGLIAAFLGVLVVFAGRDGGTPGSNPAMASTLIGDLFCLAGGVAWGGITLTVRSSGLRTAAPERIVLVQHLVAGSLLLAGSMALGEAGFTSPTLLHWGAFAWTTVFVAFFAFTTSYWLMLRYPATRIMAFMLLTPIFGVLAGVVLLAEPLTPHLLAGLALVILGLWLVNRATAPRPRVPASGRQAEP